MVSAADDRMGTGFNHRRQSRDKALRRDLICEAAGAPVWMNAYSLRQFKDEAAQADLHGSENFLFDAGNGEFCFAENILVSAAENRAEKIILYRWNRIYPADIYFDMDLSSGWFLSESRDFAGKSHEKITKEVYLREQE